MMASEWIDITVPIRNGMAYWPDNPPPRVVQAGRYDLICLPLKVDRSEGAAARAMVYPRAGEEGTA